MQNETALIELLYLNVAHDDHHNRPLHTNLIVNVSLPKFCHSEG